MLIVAPADRGHFQWTLPLQASLRARGKRVELWTHEVAAAWLPDNATTTSESDSAAAPLVVRAELGDGRMLSQFVRAYKVAVSEGNSDADGYRLALSDGHAGLRRAMAQCGVPDAKAPGSDGFDDMLASVAGREALLERLCDGDVVVVAWERVWCSWVPGLCSRAGVKRAAGHGGDHPGSGGPGATAVPSMGFMPSFLHPFRAHAGVEIYSFDGVSRVRDRRDDVDPPLLDAPSVSFDMCYVIARALMGSVPLPVGRERVGVLLPADDADGLEANPLGDALSAWLDGDGGDVTVVSLGSQSALSTLSAHAERSLLCGALAASPRVLAASSTNPASLSSSPELAGALSNGRLRLESWLPQWLVLAHARVRVMISHCGANSVHEAMANGVAVVPCPFFDDQWYIAMRLEQLYRGNGSDSPSENGGAVSSGLGCGVSKELLRGPHDRAVAGVADAVKQAFSIAPLLLHDLAASVRADSGTSRAADLLLAKATLCG